MDLLTKAFKALFKFSPILGKAAAEAQSEIIKESKKGSIAEKAENFFRKALKKEN